MEMTPYTTLQDILEEAGLVTDANGDVPNGIVDGANKIFTVPNKPLVDRNYDDSVTKDDVQIYFNGVPAEVSSLNPAYGTITTVEAPAEGVEVTVDYRYSPISMTFVGKLREEAEERINDRMRHVDNCAPYGMNGNEVPKTVRNITRQFAAAWLHIRDYGFNQDTEGTSKDGYMRLEKAAEKALERYALLGGKCGTDGSGNPPGGIGSIAATSDGDLFPEPDFDDTRRKNEDYDG